MRHAIFLIEIDIDRGVAAVVVFVAAANRGGYIKISSPSICFDTCNDVITQNQTTQG